MARSDRAQRAERANAWSVLAADPERDLVFVPTGSAAPDYYGALRLGNNRYANSIVALERRPGRVVWSFQTVHHDLWDYDNASPPALVTLTKDGARIPAVVQATKSGMLFVLNRETGAPVFPVEERPVPASDIPGEEASRDAAVHRGDAAAQSAPVHSRSGVGAVGRGSRGVPRGDRRPSQRGHLHAAERARDARDPVEHRRRALGRRGHRSRRGRSPSFRSTGWRRWCSSFRARGSISRRRGRRSSGSGDDFEYNFMHGTPYVMRRRILLAPSRAAVHAAAVRHARRHQPQDRRAPVGGAARRSRARFSLPNSPRRRNRTGARPTSAGRSRPPADWSSSARRSIDRCAPSTSRRAASCGGERCRRAARRRR